MNIAPGWYVAPGTTDVRWWDGAKFRSITLVDGVVKYSGMRSQTPRMSMMLGVIFIVLGLSRLGLASTSTGSRWDYTFTGSFIGIAIFMLISGFLGQAIEKLPAPDPAGAVWDPRTLPWPLHTEQGPIAPGWYAAPYAKIPRWWTGARWSEYVLLKDSPVPSAGQAARMRAGLWVLGGLLGAATVLLIALAVYGLNNGESEMTVVGAVGAGITGALAIVFIVLQQKYVKAYEMPAAPPFAVNAPGQFPPAPGQNFPPAPGQFPPTPGQFPPTPGQF